MEHTVAAPGRGCARGTQRRAGPTGRRRRRTRRVDDAGDPRGEHPQRFIESEERQALRKAVAAMAANYGQDYYLEKARAGQHTDELWNEAGKLGFIGVNLPEEYGGGGAGMYELSMVEMSAGGCALLLMVVSPPSTARSSASSAPTTRRSGGYPASPTVRSRWRSPSPSPTRVRTPTASPPPRGATAATGSSRARRCSSPASTRRRRCSSSAAPRRASPATSTGAVHRSHRHPGVHLDQDRHGTGQPESQFQLFLDDVRLPSDALVGSEDAAIAQLFAGLNPERIMGAASAVGMGRLAIDKAVDYVKTRQVWKTPIGAHPGPVASVGAEPHRGRAGQADDAEGRHALRQRRRLRRRRGGQHGQVRRRRGVGACSRSGGSVAGRQRVDQGIRHRGGGDRVEAARIAPVSREMVLNFMAQTSLGLPRSY